MQDRKNFTFHLRFFCYRHWYFDETPLATLRSAAPIPFIKKHFKILLTAILHITLQVLHFSFSVYCARLFNLAISKNHFMKKIAMIPARYAATRFPAKLMQPLGDKTVIATVYHNTVATGLFDGVTVVTDSDIIYNEIQNIGGHVVMSKEAHESGTDRIAEAVADMEVDVIVNVQGDSPFQQREPLQNLLQQFEDETVQVASLMQTITDAQTIANPNAVKVVVDKGIQCFVL